MRESPSSAAVGSDPDPTASTNPPHTESKDCPWWHDCCHCDDVEPDGARCRHVKRQDLRAACTCGWSLPYPFRSQRHAKRVWQAHVRDASATDGAA